MIRAMRKLLATLLQPRLPSLQGVGYEHPELLEMVFRKAVAFDKSEAAWPDMVGVSSVLDFGGGCGHHYKQAVRHSPNVRWAVVETPAMASRASEIATDRLRFFDNVSDARDWLDGNIDVMHSNGALQCTPDPLRTLRELCAVQARLMLWQRMCLSRRVFEYEIQNSQLHHNGPGKPPADVQNKIVSILRTRLPEPLFVATHGNYRIVERGRDWFKFQRLS